jgi:hypothetical protein
MATRSEAKHDRLIYSQEDPSKKLVRFMWWQRARSLNPKLFYMKKHLVLAGMGGDISVLIGMGIAQENIIAVDENKHCIFSCRDRWPDVTYILGTLAPGLQLLRWLDKGELSTAMLDFCGSPALSNRKIMWGVADKLDPMGTLGCTFLTSRGSTELAHLGQQMAKLHATDNSVLIRAYCIANGSEDWHPLIGYHYQSHQEKQTHGMLTLMLTKYMGRGAARIIPVSYTEDDVKKAVLANDDRPTFDAALMLNVPRMTVAGWKAHATRKQQAKE